MKKYILILFIYIISFVACLFIGRIGISELIMYFKENNESLEVILWDLRLPRLIAASIIGASLAISGALFQGVFQNPLVSPNILGVSSGAAFGAVVFILLGAPLIAVQFGSFVFGLVAVCLAYALGHFSNSNSKLMLILAGIVIGALFDALISIVKYVADTDEVLPNIIYWLLGSLSSISWDNLMILVPINLFGIIILCALSWKVNILALSKEQASFLGLGKSVNIICILLATLISANSISMCGIIGWIGLLIPHISRMIFGANYAKVLPSSAFLGATFLMYCDTISRSLNHTQIPLSIITALFGAPLIMIIMLKGAKKWF